MTMEEDCGMMWVCMYLPVAHTFVVPLLFLISIFRVSSCIFSSLFLPHLLPARVSLTLRIQPALVHVHRGKAARDVAGIDDGLVEKIGDPASLVRRVPGRLFFQVVAQGIGDEPYGHEILAEAVVKIMSYALLLAFADGLILGDLADHRLDRTKLTANANAYFSDAAIDELAGTLHPLGAPLSVDQTSSNQRGGMTGRRYQAKYAARTFAISVYETGDGKLEQFLVDEDK